MHEPRSKTIWVFQWKTVLFAMLFLNVLFVYHFVGRLKINILPDRKDAGLLYYTINNVDPRNRVKAHNPALNSHLAPKKNSKHYNIGIHGHNCTKIRQHFVVGQTLPKEAKNSSSKTLLKTGSQPEVLPTYSTDGRGRWFPTSCKTKQRTVIVIPYRDRADHLKIFIEHHVPIFRKQLLDYTIIVVEQDNSKRFNRGMLFNIGYKEALSLSDGNQAPLCLILHDVDLLLENDRLIYECSQYPTHFSLAIDKFQYSLPYDWLFGGVVALLGDQFEETNGFGNLFFGWGGEDDDFRERLLYAGLFPVQHDNASISRYSMITHGESKSKNEDRQNMVATGYERYHCDGLNSMEYAVNNTQYKEHFIIIKITLPLNLKRSRVCQSCFSENKDLKIDTEISDNGIVNGRLIYACKIMNT